MPRNDDGEYELVLGNRQLLSGFFFVVVLFGIFFTMGYFVGRHSSAGTVNAGQPAGVTPPAETTPAPTTPEPATTASTAPEPGRAQVVSADPATKAPADPPMASPVPTKPVQTKPVDTALSKPPDTKAEKPSVAPPALAPAAGGLNVIRPAAGDIYLQVSAPAPAAAGSVVETLKRKGINSVLAAGPDSATVRVLVGPLVPADIANARTQLENAGFKPFVRKY